MNTSLLWSSPAHMKFYRNMLITFGVISNADTQETINPIVMEKTLVEVRAL